MMSYPNSPRRPAPVSQAMSISAGPYPMMGGPFLQSAVTNSAPAVPVMTSFRDLASGSPMNSSIYSLGGRSEVADIPEEDEVNNADDNKSITPLDNRPMSKFIRFDSLTNGNDTHKEYLERKRSSGGSRQMFPMFIGLSDTGEAIEKPLNDGWKGSNRLNLSKRMSMTSLTSLTSIDITPGQDGIYNLNPTSSSSYFFLGQPPIGDMSACSKLASDLMQMYVNNEDTDCIIRTEGGDIHAHKCILSATCPFFRQQLQKSKRVEMRGFSKNSINFLLMYLYGGVTSIPDDVDVWEVVALATHLNHKDLAQVVILHLKATKCHWFHRPCASCVSAVFDCLPQLASIRCLRQLYDEAMQWQAKHFARVWKGRVFLYLNERWQKECYEAVIQHMDDETVIDVILSCERLQVAMSRSKSDSAIAVLQMVDDILDVAMQFLVHSFHLVVTSKSFQQQGKGLALNLGILEDLMVSVIHSLTADVAIKTYKELTSLLEEIMQTPPSPKRTLNIPVDEWSPRFSSLVRRMVDLTDRHLLHYAASVVRADAFNLLSDEQKRRIEETGIFVEMRKPKAPPPRLSSNSRSYKRSASVGVQNNGQYAQPRARSAERTKPAVELEQKQPAVNEKSPESRVGAKTATENVENQENIVEKSEVKMVKENSDLEKKRKIPSPQRRSRSRTSEKSQDKANEEKKMVTPELPKSEQQKQPAVEAIRAKEGVRRSPIKKKSTNSEVCERFVKEKARENKLQIEMERQTTRTIITVDKARAAQLPGPDSSPVKSVEKPKSVVKPMVKDSPLASSANRTVIRDRVSARKPGDPPRQPAAAASVKSAIPKPSASRPNSGGSKPISKPAPSLPSRKPKVPTRKDTNSIEK
ncbi:unnamed protein product [Caenorhabditis bovis]|uniref:BTB domain-containing protein n=1 Tax=Caenorhabditis bovis TaxID=2654633 RepID=A0A8S1F2J0_9PELO|nr:unnamed protein product [Caenorhabditis bovis]